MSDVPGAAVDLDMFNKLKNEYKKKMHEIIPLKQELLECKQIIKTLQNDLNSSNIERNNLKTALNEYVNRNTLLIGENNEFKKKLDEKLTDINKYKNANKVIIQEVSKLKKNNNDLIQALVKHQNESKQLKINIKDIGIQLKNSEKKSNKWKEQCLSNSDNVFREIYNELKNKNMENEKQIKILKLTSQEWKERHHRLRRCVVCQFTCIYFFHA